MAPNLARLAQYAFVTSAQLTAADQSNSNAFFLVVPTLPRGALIEIAPHYSQGWNYKLQKLFLQFQMTGNTHSWHTLKNQIKNFPRIALKVKKLKIAKSRI